jgi:hypothetical protein
MSEQEVRVARPDSTLYRIVGDHIRLYYTLRSDTGDQFFVLFRYPDVFVLTFAPGGALLGTRVLACPEWLELEVRHVGVYRALGSLSDERISELLQQERCLAAPIQVRKFSFPEHHIAIADFPASLLDIINNPSDFAEEDTDVAKAELDRWMREGMFVLWLGVHRDLWIDSDGNVESS